MAFSLTWEEHGVLVEFSGKVSAAELVKANDVWYSDPRFDTIRYYICDLTRVQHFDLAASDAEFAAATDKGASLTVERLKGALVATDAGIREMAETYIATSVDLDSTWDLRLFDSLDEARAWACACA